MEIKDIVNESDTYVYVKHKKKLSSDKEIDVKKIASLEDEREYIDNIINMLDEYKYKLEGYKYGKHHKRLT